MGKQWARQQVKTNEIAAFLERLSLWVQSHPHHAVWGGIGVLVLAVAAAGLWHRYRSDREDAWTKYALAQSLAYSGQATQGLEMLGRLAEEHPGSPAATYGQLLAGDILFEQSRFEEAAKRYREALERPAREAAEPIARANLALAQEAGGDCSAALQTGQGFLDAHQEHFLAPQVHASVGRCLSSLGRTEEARAAYERMAFLYPDTYWAEWAKARL